MKIIAIDAIDINSFGGLVHLEQILKALLKKKIFLKVYVNSFVRKNLKNSKNVDLIYKSSFDKNYFFRHLWKIFFFKKNLENTNCSILLSLNGIYHGLFKPTILLQQNILPFHKKGQSRYNFFSKIKFFLQKYAIYLSLKLHKNIIFTSNDIKKKVLKNISISDTFYSKVIYHGAEKIKKHNRTFNPEKKIKLLFVSEFQEYKNHTSLFEALKKKNNQKIELTCIGKHYKTDIDKLKSKYNLKKLKIKIFKNISHAKTVNNYKYYDALIFPSLCESFGLPVLEAARNKVPVLCSDLKVFREIYGNGCIYFNPNNSASILNKINFFISLKSKDLKKKTNYNYSRVKKFDWKLSGNEYFKMIFKVINSYEKKS